MRAFGIGRTCKGLFIACTLLHLWSWPSMAQARQLRPGEVIKLLKTNTERVGVVIPQTGEYRLQTLGDADTTCQLYDRWKGLFATDTDSGQAKNCRFDLRLVKGTYLLKVHKGNVPSTLSLHKYNTTHPLEPLLEGRLIDTSLKAGRSRNFRIDIKRRRWLSLKASGETLHHCRLLTSDGWATMATSTQSTFKLKGKHQLRQCQIEHFVEPGIYHLEVYGSASLPGFQTQRSQDSRPKKVAPLQLSWGARYLPPNKWTQLIISNDGSATLWLQIPQKYGDKHGKSYLHISSGYLHNSPNYAHSMSLYQTPWSLQQGSSIIHSSSTLSTFIQAGPRHQLRLAGTPGQKIRLMMLVLRDRDHTKLSLNQRRTLLSSSGKHGELLFDIKKAGQYWLDASPKVHSCVLEELHQSGPKQISIHGLPFSSGKKTSTPIQLQGNGLLQWLHLPQDGILEFGTEGTGDTYCQLFQSDGSLLSKDDDKGYKQNCKLRQRLKKGTYKINVRQYHRRTINTTFYYTFQADAVNAEQHDKGCGFQIHLKPGKYRLLTGQAGRFSLLTAGLLSLPLQPSSHTTLHTHKVALTLPVQFPAGDVHITIKGVRHCLLRAQQRVLLFGQQEGAYCVLKGRLQTTQASLEIAQQSTPGGDLEIKMSPNAKSRVHRFVWPQPDTPNPTLTPPAPLRTRKSHFFNLMRREEKRFLWTNTRSGLYNIVSLGLLKIGCTLQTESTPYLFGDNQGGPGDNCQLIQYLPAGRYQLRVKTLGRTRGRVGIEITRLRMARGKRISMLSARYARLYPALGRYHQFKIKRQGHHTLQLHSLDNKIFCRLEEKGGWPLFGGQQCAWSGNLDTGRYGLWLYPTPSRTRYRALLYSTNDGTQFWPSTSGRLRPRASRKAVKLPLHGSYTAHLSPLGWDLYTLHVPTNMRLQLALSSYHSNSQLTARIFKKNKFIAESETMKDQWLAPGHYRVLIQSKTGQTNVPYNIGVNVLQTTPGVRLWKTLPSTVSLKISRRSRVELQTEGDTDVWCQLYDAQGLLVANNDNMSRTRWDCRISELLNAGAYTLRIEGTGTGTWLDIRERSLQKITPLTLNKPLKLKLHREKLHAVKFKLSTVTALQLFSRSKRRQLGCTLEAQKQKSELGQSGGRRCVLFRLLVPGDYLWRVRTLSSRSTTAKVIAKTIPTTLLGFDQKVGVLLGQRTPQFLRFEIKRSGVFRLQTSSNSSLRCGLAPQGGKLGWVPCNKQLSLSRGWYLWWLENRGTGTKTLQAQIVEESMVGDLPFPISLRSAQSQHYKIKLSKDGLYAIDVTGEGSASWQCKIGHQRGIWSAHKTSPSRCRLFASLKAGEHLLQLWRPAESGLPVARGKVTIQHLHSAQPPKDVRLWTPTVHEGTLHKTQQRLWSLSASHGLSGAITLQGKGLALLVDANSRLLASCENSDHTVKTCDWGPDLSGNTAQLWLLTDPKSTLRYSISLQEAPSLSRPALQPGQSLVLPGDQLNRDLTLPIQGKGASILEVLGKNVRCRLVQGDLSTREGCRHHIQHGAHPVQLQLEQRGDALRVLLYKPGQRAAALWGSPRPVKLPALASPGKAVKIDADSLLWRGFRLDKAQVVHLRFSGTAATCAIGQSGRPALISRSGQRGCEIELPLQSGSYWFGARNVLKQPLHGWLFHNRTPFQKLSDGRHGPALLGRGARRWVRFEVGTKQKVGVGAVAEHEEIACRLLNASYKVVLSDCMSYPTLAKGTYWFQVALSTRSRATALSVVIRGLKPPPLTPPPGYLKALLGGRP